ncbi:MAG: hypothetical protein A3G33_07120 [Omnitrophica bacterium RIFCSPLOWO2_12_FULL_44_17]|uniref:VWFA domain-containing protein n=1 Tax=Candidatus Danuiimicrobium aquiferis TaxID=1801832 RepID=A0A1G1KYW2_9BACT|nr:MAG: hypothetical protein A3B72_07415 [Omnitrophica bacterium RIFCSPHIGHO2_02_FULL_45_28]OGW90403.1 MAG: hypothetical protein A3E74_07155 [Omnitrophica bacterium RIFCSPHIGHO2_12_FULL_44_12]OGW98094.1 MAG: hypothetical protein A3G33_07120 [Omnitrophica bacterium RIFCSPLOWO2_12_FULL_44_17]OGX03592.1 MAG: hypothetical protein A3J12_03110 [Omnitrophica bacterium RIFCSPLOWO2_02_FULL_44_11]
MKLSQILDQVKQIEIKSTRLVNEIFAGEYQSVFKGRGMEFAEVREYVPGDDIRTIDWNVTARSQHPFIKKFIEERELTVIFVVDGSRSLYFGSTEKMKATLAAEIAALLAFSAVKNHDKVGLLIYTDTIEKFLPPKKGKSNVLRVVREVLYHQPTGKQTNLKIALEYLNQTVKRNAVVFVISDFIDHGYEQALKIANRKHDLIAIQIIDPREQKLPPCGWIEMEDGETSERALVNTQDKRFRDDYEKVCLKREAKTDYLFKLMGIDSVKIIAGTSYVHPLVKFFRRREKRL